MTYGQGTVFWREDRKRWVGQYEVHTGSPKRRRRTVSDPDKRECQRKLREAIRVSATLPAYDARLRVDRFLRIWLDERVAGSVRPRTADFYGSVATHHIAPALGGHRLVDLRKLHVLQWRNVQLERGDHPRSVSHRMAVLRAALGWAVEMEMIATNPGEVSGPSVPQSTAKPLTVAEARRFLAHVAGQSPRVGGASGELSASPADPANNGQRKSGSIPAPVAPSAPDPMYAVYLLAFTLGMRQGEILGLRWQYVTLPTGDSAAGKLEIAADLVWLHGEPLLGDPKTDRSHRTLNLPARVAEALEARRVAQRIERMQHGQDWSPNFDAGYDFVFTNERGYPIERTRITRAFQRHLAAVGLPKVPMHSARHTATDWMTELGMTMREVADVLGHARPSQTSDTYSYLGTAPASKAARLLDEALG